MQGRSVRYLRTRDDGSRSALSMPGIEVRMPAIHITSAGHQIPPVQCLPEPAAGSGALPGLDPACVSGFGGASERQPAHRSGGDQRRAATRTAQSIFMLRSADLETRLRLNYPELASANVSVGLPNTVMCENRGTRTRILLATGRRLHLDRCRAALRSARAAICLRGQLRSSR